MGRPHRLGHWALLLLLGSPPTAALAELQRAAAGGKGEDWAALVAQVGGRGEQEIPAEVREWVERAWAAYSRGDAAEALRLQLEAMKWVDARLGPVHLLRAVVLNNLSLFLSAIGRRQEALAPIEEAVKIYRELAKTNPAYLGNLAGSLTNLGSHYIALGRRQEALSPTEEAVKIRRVLAKNDPSYLDDLARSLTNLGGALSELGRRQEALPPAQEALMIFRKLAEIDRAYLDDLALSLTKLGKALSELGRRQQALDPTKEALNIFRDLARLNPPLFLGDLAGSLNNLSIAYGELGRGQEALAPTEEAVKIYRELAKTNPAYLGNLAGSLANLGSRYSALGRRHEGVTPTGEAVRLYRELAKTDPAVLGDLANSLNRLGLRYSELGRRQQALGPTEEAVKIFRELAKTNPAYLAYLAASLSNLGLRYSELGRRQQALDPTEEAVKIFRDLGKTDGAFLDDLARSLANLGKALSELGRHQNALDSGEEAVKIIRELMKTNTANLGDLAQSLNSLGIRYTNLGRHQEALATTQEAVKIYRELAKTNPAYLGNLAGSLAHLGSHYIALGRRQEALATTQEAVKIYRELATTNTAFLDDLAMALSNLGTSLSDLGRRQEALGLTEEAVKIYRELATTNTAFLGDLAMALSNLGTSLSDLGRRQEALGLTEEAVKITRELKMSNPAYLGDLANYLTNLGVNYIELGRRQEALAPSEEAITITRELSNANTAYQDDLALAARNMAFLQLLQGNLNAAFLLLREAVGSEVTYLQAQLPLVPEARRAALVGAFGDRWQAPFSLAQRGDEGAALALFTRLNRQGLLQDIRRNQVLLARSGPHRPLFEQLTVVTNQLARPNVPQEEEKALLARKEQLEQELYRLLPQVKPRLVKPEQVALRLPADGVLVEFQRYQSINTSTGLDGPPRYLALVLTPKGAIHAVPLGDASELEPILQKALRLAGAPPDKFTAEAQLSKARAQQAMAEVRRRLLDALLPHIGAAKRWIVSPDGEIHRVPLAALPASDGDLNGATLGETRQLQVITTGRELLEEAPAPASALAALVMADPDYDTRLGTTAPGTRPQSTRPQTRSSDDLAKGWTALTHTQAEGQEVAALLGTGLISGVQATTTQLQRAQGPRIVHIATHGFFLPDRKEDLDAKGPFQGFTRLEMPLLAREDPQLRSGIVLAGANHPEASAEDDGRLTALEATELNLSGTELVTLSACSTGLGSQATGEGVYGLQRSLRVAGAHSTLLSLWEVDDNATKIFMLKYYKLLKQGVGRAEALRQVQRELRGQAGWSHPHFWAAWQLSGDGEALPMGDRLPR